MEKRTSPATSWIPRRSIIWARWVSMVLMLTPAHKQSAWSNVQPRWLSRSPAVSGSGPPVRFLHRAAGYRIERPAARLADSDKSLHWWPPSAQIRVPAGPRPSGHSRRRPLSTPAIRNNGIRIRRVHHLDGFPAIRSLCNDLYPWHSR